MATRKGLWRDIPITADTLRALGDDELQDYLKELNSTQLDEIMHLYEFWARPSQLEPEGNGWDTWLFNAGRGAGKTFSGANWVRHRIKCGDKRIACVAPTKGDVRRVMVEGESGFLNMCWKGDKTYRGAKMGYPEWSPTNNTLTWENGATATFFSAEDPDRLRGPQFHAAWCDELAAWKRDQDTWDMLQFCLRLGKHPRICVTTTPKPTKLVRTILKQSKGESPKVIITSGSTFDNSANLAKTYLEAV